MSELPPGWVMASLEEVIVVLDSARVPLNAAERERRTAGKREEELFPYFGAAGQVGQIDGYIFDEPLVLLGEDGVQFLEPLRTKAYQVDGKCWVNNHAHVLRTRGTVADRRYLTGYLNSFDYAGYVSGTTRLKLTQAAMNSIPIRLPPLNEQRRIADKLDVLLAQVDACRERLDRVSTIVKRFRQAVLAAATSGSLGDGESAAGFLPLRGTLDNVFTGPFGSALHKADYVEGGVPVINPMHINRGLITPSMDVAVSHQKAAELAEFKLQAGDVIVARRGVMGRCAVVAENQTGWLGGTGSMVLRPSAKLDPDFLQMFISSPATVAALEEAAVGSTMANLNQGILLALELWLPAVEQQRRIVNEARRLFNYADRLEQRIQATQARVERLTPALLAKAFRGELVPQDPNDESAEVLLERLRQSAGDGETKRRPGRRSASR